MVDFVTLGSLLAPVKSKRAGKDKYPLLSITRDSGLVFQASRFKKRIAGADLSNYKVITKGQLVVGFPIDEAVIDFQTICEAGIVSPAYGVWELLDEQRVDIAYLREYLRSDFAVAQYKLRLRGTTARRRSLTKEAFRSIQVPLPPLNEQRRIAAILDEVEKVRFSQAAKLRCLYEQVDARSSKIAEEANVTKRFDELCDVQGGISLGGARKKYPESAPYLRVANVFRNAIDLSEVKNVPIREGELEKYSLLSGDILVVEAHGNRLEVGRGAMLTESLEGHVYQNHLFRVRPHKGVDSETLVQLWNSPRVRKQILSTVSTTSGLNTTSISKIRSIQVPIPTSKAQAEFSEMLHALTGLITQEKQKLNKILELTSSLSTRAFQGEL